MGMEKTEFFEGYKNEPEDKPMKTEKSNKLIWEFMRRNLQDARYTMPELLQYHKSWDWLMPVVKKMEKETGYGLVSYPDEAYFNDGGDMLTDKSYFGTRFTAVYNTIIAAIEWYNENNK